MYEPFITGVNTMKRLTISMSDELFDRLNEIENKSLFVRDIIERELSSENVGDGATAPWLDELNEFRVENKELTDRLNKIEKRLESTQSMVQAISRTAETKSIERVIPKMETAVPKLTPTREVVSEPKIAPIEEIKPTSDIQELLSTIKEPNSLEEALPETSTNNVELSESVSPTPTPSESVSPTPTPLESVSSTPTPSESIPPTPTPSAPPQPVIDSDKLGGNILMYIPQGAEIKRNIIKSLLSKRYDPSEIDVKLDQMIGAGTLSTAIKEDVEYLIRA